MIKMMADRIEKLRTELTTAPPIVLNPQSHMKAPCTPMSDPTALKALQPPINITVGQDGLEEAAQPKTAYDAAVVKQQVTHSTRNMKPK